MKFQKSLLYKYLLIIICALLLLPFTFPLISFLFFMPVETIFKENPNIYNNGEDLEEMWHKEAKGLAGASDDEVSQKLNQLHKKYSKANMFWVDKEGITKLKLPKDIDIPQKWNTSYTVEFMKKSYGADPFTTVAFIDEEKTEGFIVFQVPRSFMISTGKIIQEKYWSYGYMIVVLIMLTLFMFISWLFFYRIRKRLISLIKAMAIPADNGIPLPISVGKKDEIGQLEKSFNEMIHQLETSRKREKEEENLRRQLIANLSHDLRTPLTTIRSHAFSLKKEPISSKGAESLELIDKKIHYLGELIENLLSYTLLSARKYPFHPEKTDIVRFIRASFAAWYPVYENLGFEIELGIPDKSYVWHIDPQWMNRILDNFFQNIARHAKEGKYIAVYLIEDGKTLTIKDRGPGMNQASKDKGAGIGLTIAALMIKEMKLDWEIKTSESGTTIQISKGED
ncbi:histidine kinase dimerization/phospho-acceptor domain-containing protein [Bacillus sp. 03113]|uniref:sensor histidine kinase n=1 Tax=Bacillus sp. 03113 TaxID=2578211 RepID=UPI0011437C9B|nr:histidine kinase dimerization/phospho-acceptor domain-containing protein [Bacillus sp. 03113]